MAKAGAPILADSFEDRKMVLFPGDRKMSNLVLTDENLALLADLKAGRCIMCRDRAARENSLMCGPCFEGWIKGGL